MYEASIGWQGVDEDHHEPLPADDLKLAKNNPKDPLPDIRPTVCTGADGMVNAPCGF